jgi:hypothetical protein
MTKHALCCIAGSIAIGGQHSFNVRSPCVALDLGVLGGNFKQCIMLQPHHHVRRARGTGLARGWQMTSLPQKPSSASATPAGSRRTRTRQPSGNAASHLGADAHASTTPLHRSWSTCTAYLARFCRRTCATREARLQNGGHDNTVCIAAVQQDTAHHSPYIPAQLNSAHHNVA